MNNGPQTEKNCRSTDAEIIFYIRKIAQRGNYKRQGLVRTFECFKIEKTGRYLKIVSAPLMSGLPVFPGHFQLLVQHLN